MWTVILTYLVLAVHPSSAQDKLKSYLAELDRLDAQGKAIFDREMARANAADRSGDCPQADTTRAIEECLGAEIAASRANLDAFSSVIRSILGLATPGDQPPAPGPTGTPLTPGELVKRFDEAEAAWDHYAKTQVSTAYDLWRGGTYAPVASLTCELLLIRGRMRELNLIYDSQLRHH